MSLGELKITCYESNLDVTPLVVTLSDCFLSTDPPRTDAAIGADSIYSSNGNYLQLGTSFELPAFWTINALVSEATGDRLLAIWQIREAKRLAQQIFSATGYRIELDDEIQVVNEYGKTALTKTRTSVTGTTPVEKDKGVFYYARWLVDLPTKPVFGRIEDGFQTATFTLKDVGIKI